jgi:hypothetical protein
MLKEVGSWRRDMMMGFDKAADVAEVALDAAAKLGVKNVPGRFAEYLPLLRQVAPIKSSPLPWAAGSRERALFYEGAGQVRHLLKASEVWPLLPRDEARHKLTKALAGNAIPEPASQVDRQARDFMAEFSTAWALKERGLRVRMPNEGGREDVWTKVEGVGELLVECKRPQSVTSIADKLKEGCDKLAGTSQRAGLCDGQSKIGLVVIAIDRILDGCVVPAAFRDLPEVPSFRDEKALAWWIEHAFEQRIFEAIRAQQKARLQPFPRVPLVGLLLSILVFVNEDAAGGFLHNIDYLAFFNTGPSWDAFPALKKVFFDESRSQ